MRFWREVSGIFLISSSDLSGQRIVLKVASNCLGSSASTVFVCWILMALLVATREKTTGADGSWRFLVSQQVKLKDAAVFISVVPPAHRLQPGFRSGFQCKVYLYNKCVADVPPCVRVWPCAGRLERGLWSHQSLIIPHSNSVPIAISCKITHHFILISLSFWFMSPERPPHAVRCGYKSFWHRLILGFSTKCKPFPPLACRIQFKISL